MSVRVNVRMSKIMRTPIKVGVCVCVCVCVRVRVYFLPLLLLTEQNSKCNARDQVSDAVLRKLLCQVPSSPPHR